MRKSSLALSNDRSGGQKIGPPDPERVVLFLGKDAHTTYTGLTAMAPRALVMLIGIAALAAGCGSSPAGGPSAPCIPPGAAPAFSLVSPPPQSKAVGSPGSVLIATDKGDPPFQATLNLVPTMGSEVRGSGLQSAAPPPNASSTLVYFSATYPSLQQTTTYDVQLNVTEYTNLPASCQKSFIIDSGQITTAP